MLGYKVLDCLRAWSNDAFFTKEARDLFDDAHGLIERRFVVAYQVLATDVPLVALH